MAGHKVGIVMGHMERGGNAGFQTDIVTAIKAADGMVGTVFIWHTHTPALVTCLGAALPVMLLKMRTKSKVSVSNRTTTEASSW
jgi:hypothetical protein